MILGRALALRTGAVIAATVALAVLLSMVLAALKFERTLHDVTSSRLSVVADEVRRRVEYGLTLGLDLSELVDVQGLVERAAEPEEIENAEVVGEDGTVLFAANLSSVGRPSTVAWEPDSAPVPGGIRQRIDGDAIILGAGVRNSFGQLVGEVIIRSSLSGLNERINAVARHLLTSLLVLLGVAALATLGAVVLVVGRGGRRLAGEAAGSGAISGAVRRRLQAGVAEADAAMADLDRDMDAMERATPQAVVP
ncbi:hypothetical protein [Azospirillum thermophilum]|uniref:Uncharacterized protein n=1 Tax=Azospirillum thermophilum TaxID=2202148 RepID=A0A2S2CS61_9PROT|nr:hypothetical protein [Azospirillum thermophilum]AWK87210.1 hypothetical protein DEW08_14160 [Azospirillum thermophilum]